MDAVNYEYKPGRFLTPGCKFTASGGPVLPCQSGRVVRFGERGEFVYLGLESDAVGNLTLIARRPTNHQTLRLVVHRSETADKSYGVEYRPYTIRCKRDPGKRTQKLPSPPSHVS